MKAQLVLDYSLMRLMPSLKNRRLGLLLLASSHVMNTFQVRPFSNSIEAVLVSLSLVLLCNMTADITLEKVGSDSLWYRHILGPYLYR